MARRLVLSLACIGWLAACGSMTTVGPDGARDSDAAVRVDARSPPACVTATTIEPTPDAGTVDLPVNDAGPRQVIEWFARPPGTVAGERSRLWFGYDTLEVLNPAYPWRPMMVGTRETIHARATARVTSVASATADGTALQVGTTTVTHLCCEPDASGADSCGDPREPTPGCIACDGPLMGSVAIPVQARAAGRTRLVLRTADGAELEAIEADVREPAALELRRYLSGPDVAVPSVALGGAPLRFRVRVTDAGGQVLQAIRGITASTSDPAVFQVRNGGGASPFPLGSSVESFDIELVRQGAGAATLTLVARGLRVEIPVGP